MTEQKQNDIDAFFNPKSVAVFGSLRELPGTAFWVIRNLKHFGFSGPIYPINPAPSKYNEVLGAKVYSSLGEFEGGVDLVVIITPPSTIPDIVEECTQKGVKAAIIMSEGFAEAGKEGEDLQKRAVEIARRTGMRIMGPNTFGTVNTSNGLVTVPPYVDNETLEKGGIAFCSQTGSIGPHQMPLNDWAYPLSKMCDIGNKCDVDEVDMMNYLAEDPETSVVAMHLEDVRDGKRFMTAARNLASRKPLIILKTGRSKAGAKASASHTGSIMGRDHIYDAALKQAGAIRVNNWKELWEVPKMFYFQPLPDGDNYAVVTFTGGQGVIAADEAADAGLSIAKFTTETVDKLSSYFHRLGNNPVDIGPAMSDSRSQNAANPFSAVEESSIIVLKDKNTDCVTLTLYSGNQMAMFVPEILNMVDRITKGVTKPLNIWLYGTSLSSMQELARQLQAKGLPVYMDLDMAIKSLGYAAYYSKIKSTL